MGFSTILFLIFILILGVYSYSFLALNKKVISVDLLFFNLDIEVGEIILLSILIGILIAIILEIIVFSSTRKKNDE